jgi:hypothetical protein
VSEQELVRALQELIARHSPPAEPHRLSAEIVSRDHWRIRLLGGVTALLWLGGIAGVLYMIFWFNRFIIAYTPGPLGDPHDQPGWQLFHIVRELHHSLEGCMAAVLALLLAGLCTVWLVFSSRRATLNQINNSLVEISEQFRQMRQQARLPDGDRIVPR